MKHIHKSKKSVADKPVPSNVSPADYGDEPTEEIFTSRGYAIRDDGKVDLISATGNNRQRSSGNEDFISESELRATIASEDLTDEEAIQKGDALP